LHEIDLAERRADCFFFDDAYGDRQRAGIQFVGQRGRFFGRKAAFDLTAVVDRAVNDRRRNVMVVEEDAQRFADVGGR
jgi:hypothetical protein